MQNRLLIGLIAITVLVGTSDVHSAATNTADTVQRLASSKHNLITGIRHAEKLGGTAISAKFEVEGGKFWLSVYSAKNGMDPDAEHNTLIEYKGEANETLFDPKPEVPSVEVALATPEGKSVTVDVDLRSGKAVRR